ncbi:MAG TPA: MBL fold metallo-hydrolase [Steroidobacteraceae bacterium]|nr:MBL fold metallo-hydrolase [Steroidobacteraceae bacterium]
MRFPGVLALVWAVTSAVPAAALDSGSMDVRWNTGAPDCHLTSAPPLQVHRYNEQTYILRESLCVSRRAPFMYLLIGSKRALLIDTGAVTDAAVVPLAQTVLSLLPGSGPTKLPLLVVHTHGHSDHRSGDAQFRSLPNVQIVGTDLDQVKQYFGFKDWPNGSAAVNLGDSQVDVLPTPGHDKAEVSYYDRRTGLFFSGDFFQPGRLLIADRKADLASAQRMADFVRFHSIAYVLGGHIDLDADGHGFGWLGSHYHPNEHVLQMPYDALTALPVIVGQFNGFYTRYGMFVMLNYNLVLGAIILGLAILLAVVVLAIRHLIIRRRENAV